MTTRSAVAAIILTAVALAAAAFFSRPSPAPRWVPGANTPPLELDDHRVPSPPADPAPRTLALPAGGAQITLDTAPFRRCSAEALDRLERRVTDAIGRAARSIGDPAPTTRPDVRIPDRSTYPLSTDDVVAAGPEPTPLLLFPAPETARAALDARLAEAAPPASTLAAQADAMPRSAVTLFFTPPDRAPDAALWIPTPRNHHSPLPGVTR